MGIRSDATFITPVDGCLVFVETWTNGEVRHDATERCERAHFDVVAGGDFPAGARAEARAKIAALGRYTNEPILHCRVRLSRSYDPAVARPVIAQGNLDLNGRMLRAQVAADNAHDAVALLETDSGANCRGWPVTGRPAAERCRKRRRTNGGT